MSPSFPPVGSAVPEDMPAAVRKPALPVGMRDFTAAMRSRVLLISLAPQRTRPSSPVSGTNGYPAACAASPTAIPNLPYKYQGCSDQVVASASRSNQVLLFIQDSQEPVLMKVLRVRVGYDRSPSRSDTKICSVTRMLL